MLPALLIANRGEIARRIIRTARRLGIETVAVYSDADVGAAHVREADRALRLGPAPAAQSYLDIAALIAAARAGGAGAVHPGYGFLAENPDFARACLDAGLVWVGPPPAAIAAMGDKARARMLMSAAGIACTPGYDGAAQDEASLAAAAAALGYPLLVKAAAGGGGKGMRRVDCAADFAAALAACRREAAAAFGDDRLLLERYIERARHVEVQVFADAHGRVLALGERDCSTQRRHQKLIEEAPAPGLDAALRTAMAQAACACARAVDYRGAGTVEFIVEAGARFWFMEMNTRLQVEHAVTECVTGLDLVAWQLQIAAGRPLPDSAPEVRGHAIEARLYAEDPQQGFLPAAGRLLHLQWPAGAGLRVDAAVEQGDTVGSDYDALLAKLIAWGEDREQARRRLAAALAATRIAGVRNNRDLLLQVVEGAEFASGAPDTGYIERALADPTHPLAAPPVPPAPELLCLAALGQLLSEQAPAAGPWQADGWRLGAALKRRLDFHTEQASWPVWVHYRAAGVLLQAGFAEPVEAEGELTGTRLQARLGGHVWHCELLRDGAHWQLWCAGRSLRLGVRDPLARSLAAADSSGGLRAPIPGRIGAWLVQPGTQVGAGTPLIVLEAMKMEHTLSAPCAGRVVGFAHAPGERADEGSLLVHFEPAAVAPAVRQSAP